MFEEFVKKLQDQLKTELPGFSAQKLMAPLGRKPPIEYLKKGIVPKKSAVLILLYPQTTPFSVKTVLIQRPENEGGAHAGQISFPGGAYDKSDPDLRETALREAEEEIGVNRGPITVIGELSPLYIPVSNFMVQPFVGITNKLPEFNIHTKEVTRLIEVSINDLLEEGNRKTIERFIKVLNAEMQVPCYDINGKIIWGATAMIIAEFAEIIRRIK